MFLHSVVMKGAGFLTSEDRQTLLELPRDGLAEHRLARRTGCRIRLDLLPPYCPHLNPIERLWGAMHRAITHNRCSRSFAAFRVEVLTFLRHTVQQNWATLYDTITDNFRVRDPALFRILK